MVIEKVETCPADIGRGPFATFTEWATPEEDEAWKTSDVPEPARWDVWVVPFPSRTVWRKAPSGLVISADELLRDHGLVWMAMITAPHQPLDERLEVRDLSAAGLDDPVPHPIARSPPSSGSPHSTSRSPFGTDVKSVLSGLSRYLPTSDQAALTHRIEVAVPAEPGHIGDGVLLPALTHELRKASSRSPLSS
jgi:hypothetical protein